ncbi:Spore protein SP21 [Planctomycetes bacterium Pan216]|uniref:Spore protein SP21 n=1 Tax=Kolteria novifilia TaxID=2527975 RepID=A0A518B9Y5_9BACT|nr:Spore protein SP21 [Planctomycetes bacterium Pan216]
MRMLALRNGISDWNRFQKEMDELFQGALSQAPAAGRALLGRSRGTTPLRVWEDDNSYHVEAELPGLKLEDLEILVHRNEVSLSGERKIEFGEEVTAGRRERVADKIERKLQLPLELDADKAEASLVNGILTLTLPKAEAAKPRKIEVSAG